MYSVSSEVKEKFEALRTLEQVKKAMDFIKADEAATIEEQKELVLIEAPTFEETERAKVMGEKFKALGLVDVQIDRHGNVFGYRKGKGDGPIIVIEGHLDTVFPFGTAKEIIEKDGKIYCPGICDDTRGLATVLGVLRALNHAEIETCSDIIFMGTAMEEGMGGLSGMKLFLDDHPEVCICLCVDGGDCTKITYESTGIRTLATTFYGIGGHALGDYGLVANPLHAAARAIAKMADIKQPSDPKSCMVFSNFHAGNDEGIHAIVKEATIKYNFRSNDAEVIKGIEKQVANAIDEAVKEENAVWNKDEITYKTESFVDVPAGTQPSDSPIVQATYHILGELGMSPSLGQGGSTNASMAIGKGIPAICVGGGGKAGGVHTTDEWYDPTDSYKGVQLITLLALYFGFKA